MYDHKGYGKTEFPEYQNFDPFCPRSKIGGARRGFERLQSFAVRRSYLSYDRNAICCGASCWRWVYHALHSADKWFINPCVYEEPIFHENGMDNPDNPTSVILSDEELLIYLDQIEKKTYDYLDSLTDDMLYECPENCEHTRMELVLRQFRHISFHTGMLNGQTAVATGKFPMWVSQSDKFVDDGIYFGRYRKGQVKQ